MLISNGRSTQQRSYTVRQLQPLQKSLHSFRSPPDCPQFDIAALTARLQLNARVFIVPAVADDGRIIAVHRRLHGTDRLTVMFLVESRSLKHQIFRLRQMNGVKAIGNNAHIVCFDLDTLYIGRSVWFFCTSQAATWKQVLHKVTSCS